MPTNITELYGIKKGPIKWRSQTFTASGTWIRPPGVEMVRVTLVGGGGGGGPMYNVYGSGLVTAGSDGGNSVFNAPSVHKLVSRGGRGSGINKMPNGGGVKGGIASGQYNGWDGYYWWYWGYWWYPNWRIANFFTGNAGGGDGIGAGSSISGGGGGMFPNYYWWIPDIYSGFDGGNVVGYGTGGKAGSYYSWAGGGGGGASFGNGGNGYDSRTETAPTDGTLGGGGGGGSYGSGGGGGEILIREVPVYTDISVIIGQGGSGGQVTNPNSYYQRFRGASGGSGLCIVSWEE